MILLDPELEPAPAPASTSAKKAVASGASAPTKNLRLPTARTLARFLAQAQAAVRLKGQVNVLLTTDAAIRKLNKQFRGKNKATDVLSFPAGGVGAEEMAGDLAVSVPTALKQAISQGHSLSIEVKVLILHGLLHLAGYDHEADTGQMARRERKLRASLKLPQGLIERADKPPSVEARQRPKGTGFSPYVAPARDERALAPEGEQATSNAILQGQEPGSPVVRNVRAKARTLHSKPPVPIRKRGPKP